MPTWLIIVLAVLVALVVLLAVGGAVANARRTKAGSAAFDASIEETNRALAAAHAEDKGWEPGALREAARRTFEAEKPGAVVGEMELVQVIDKPGIEDDQAVFRFHTEDGATHHLTLGREDEGWRLESLA